MDRDHLTHPDQKNSPRAIALEAPFDPIGEFASGSMSIRSVLFIGLMLLCIVVGGFLVALP